MFVKWWGVAVKIREEEEAHIKGENPHHITPKILGSYSSSEISQLIQDLGEVYSVNGVLPNEKGNVLLTAKDVNAVPARMDKPYAIDEQPIYKAPAFYTKYMGLVFGDSTVMRIGDKEKDRDLPYLTAPTIKFQTTKGEAYLYPYNGAVLTEDMTDEVYADGIGVTGFRVEITSLNETLESVA